MKKLDVLDITFRAIEEKGVLLTFREKLSLAEKIDSLMVDAIELPLFVNSKENELIYRTIASSIKNATVKIPVGADLDSIEVAKECVKTAKEVCLQVAMPISTAQMEYNYHLKAPAMLEKIEALVKKSKEVCRQVEFIALDAFRAEEGFLEQCAKVASNAGANIITVCDDAGIAFPEDYKKAVKSIKDICDAKVYVQPNDSLKLATANALASIYGGADGVKTSVCGDYLNLAVICDVIRAKKFDMGVNTKVDITNVKTASSVIAGTVDNLEQTSQENVAKEKLEANASMGDICEAIKSLGYELTESDVGKVFEEFNRLTQKKEVIDLKELEAIIASTAMQVPSTYHLVNYVVNSGNIIPATANVTLEKDGEKFTGVSTGDGPIDAAFHAIEQVIGHHYELDDFQVHAVTKGRGAVGSSLIRLRADGKLYPGNGVSTDIVGACIRAYINALNKIVYEEK